MLEDGTYDALVVDTTQVDSPGRALIELTILSGPHKGEVVSIRAEGIDGDPVDLLGVPATLTVRDGKPSVVFEP